MNSYAFLGGSFDPIHLGHLHALHQVGQLIPYQYISIIPYAVSPSAKRPQASAQQRLAMVRLAVAAASEGKVPAAATPAAAPAATMGHPNLSIEELELQQDQPAYTYNSLRALRQVYGEDAHFSFIIGDDCYASLPTWQHWQELAELTNLVVMNRTRPEINPEILAWETGQRLFSSSSQHPDSEQYEEFLAATNGCIMKLEIPLFPVSSTAIRANLAARQDVSAWVPAAVLEYIKAQGLYGLKHFTN